LSFKYFHVYVYYIFILFILNFHLHVSLNEFLHVCFSYPFFVFFSFVCQDFAYDFTDQTIVSILRNPM
jgi:hypothetical protein